MSLFDKYRAGQPPFGWLKCHLCHDGRVTHHYVIGSAKDKLGRRTYGICTQCNYNYNQKIK